MSLCSSPWAEPAPLPRQQWQTPHWDRLTHLWPRVAGTQARCGLCGDPAPGILKYRVNGATPTAPRPPSYRLRIGGTWCCPICSILFRKRADQ